MDYSENKEIDGNKQHVKITLNDIILSNRNYKFSNEYFGKFNLDLAREKEEIDFFALGHPLIDFILEYCRSYSLRGTITVLNLKKDLLLNSFTLDTTKYNELFLFIFEIKFQGYIIETQISATVLDEKGNELQAIAEYILNIEIIKPKMINSKNKEGIKYPNFNEFLGYLFIKYPLW
ncbi:hypothetical protein ES703_110119 [subsurface metagenome]